MNMEAKVEISIEKKMHLWEEDNDALYNILRGTFRRINSSTPQMPKQQNNVQDKAFNFSIISQCVQTLTC